VSATIVDALIVTLGLDAKEFERGQKRTLDSLDKTRKDADKTAKDVEQAGKRAAQFFTQMRNEALAFFAVLAVGSGLKSFVKDTISTASGLERMSANLDMSAKDLAEWQLAAKHVGGTAEGMTATLQQAADDIAKFKMGFGSESLSGFFRMGGTTDQLKDANTYLLARADIIKKIYDVDPNKARVVAAMMGITDEGAFNLAKRGAAGMEEQRRAQAALAEEFQRVAKRAEEMRQKLDALSNRFDAIKIRIFEIVLPALEDLVGWLDAHKEDIAKWFEDAVKRIEEFAKSANKAADSVGGWQTILVALIGLKLLSFTANLIGMAGALGRVGSALGMIGTLGGPALKVLGPLGLLLHSDDLNKGEDEELARRKANANPTVLAGNTASRQQFLLSKLKADGYTDAQAAGIIGSLMQESGLNPGAVNPKSGAAGIAQWLGSRKSGFASRYGHDLSKSTFEEQVDYMLWELRNTEKRSGNLLRRAPNADMAAQIHAWEYERPGTAEANIAARMRYAQSVLATYGGGSAMAAAQLPSAARAPSAPVAAPGNSVSSETHIGVINVQTQATDANGIAKDLQGAVSRYSMASQANTGLN
jgi:hypothetical protein